MLAGASDAAYDLVFLDAERSEYPELWPDLLRVLRPGGLLVVDNVRSRADELVPFRRLVDASAQASAVELPVGAGLLLVLREAPAGASPTLRR